jgi:hypothetical protein
MNSNALRPVTYGTSPGNDKCSDTEVRGRTYFYCVFSDGRWRKVKLQKVTIFKFTSSFRKVASFWDELNVFLSNEWNQMFISWVKFYRRQYLLNTELLALHTHYFWMYKNILFIVYLNLPHVLPVPKNIYVFPRFIIKIFFNYYDRITFTLSWFLYTF